jgi:hypothetical protein
VLRRRLGRRGVEERRGMRVGCEMDGCARGGGAA